MKRSEELTAKSAKVGEEGFTTKGAKIPKAREETKIIFSELRVLRAFAVNYICA